MKAMGMDGVLSGCSTVVWSHALVGADFSSGIGNGLPQTVSQSLKIQSSSSGITRSHGQPNAFRKRAVVDSSTSISPASIRWTLRMFRSASSASRCWLKPLAARSRRILLPNRLSHGETGVDFDTLNKSTKKVLTDTAHTPYSASRYPMKLSFRKEI